MNNKYKWIMNSLLAGVIAMGFGTTGAYADEANTSATTQQSTVTPTTIDATTVDKATAPALVPGDLFYFLKMFVETIQVVLMDNDIDKAKMLAVQAEERVNEASALFADGKTDLAMKTLNKAFITQNQAVEIVPVTDDANAAHDGDDNKDEDDDHEGEKKDAEELESQLQHNIEALTKALEHVKNPTARAALNRNIEKLLDKALKAEDLAEVADDAEASINVTVTVSDKEHATDDDHDDDHDDKIGTETDKAAAKAAHEQAKAAKKAAHEQAKAAKKAAHEQAKAAKKAAHEQAKAKHWQDRDHDQDEDQDEQ